MKHTFECYIAQGFFQIDSFQNGTNISSHQTAISSLDMSSIIKDSTFLFKNMLIMNLKEDSHVIIFNYYLNNQESYAYIYRHTSNKPSLDDENLNINLKNLEHKQIKSSLRTKNAAEVFTNEREVNAMLDLIPTSIGKKDYISMRFLEPACGNGNFLVEILDRKMKEVAKKCIPKKDSEITDEDKKYHNLTSFEYFSIKALSSMYGIDICPENVQETKDRLYIQMIGYFSLYRNSDQRKQSFLKTLRYILSKNIICGNSLEDQDTIILSEFTSSGKFGIKEKRFTLKELYKKKPIPFEEYKVIHFLKLGEEEKKPQPTLFTFQNEGDAMK